MEITVPTPAGTASQPAGPGPGQASRQNRNTMLRIAWMATA
jgi:hypothetical protein